MKKLSSKILAYRIKFHYDLFRSVLLTILLSSTLIISQYLKQPTLGILIGLGILMAYFPDMDGDSKNRSIGIAVGVLLGAFNLSFWSCFVFPIWLSTLLLSFSVFSIGLISAYGYRGSMVSFSGLFGVAMHFGFKSNSLSFGAIFGLVSLGGLLYLIIGSIVRPFFQQKQITIHLSGFTGLVADLFEAIETPDVDQNNDQKILKIINKINEKQDLIRSLLLDDKKFIKTDYKPYFLLFSELNNFYETLLSSVHDSMKSANNFAELSHCILQRIRAIQSQLTGLPCTDIKTPEWSEYASYFDPTENKMDDRFLQKKYKVEFYFLLFQKVETIFEYTSNQPSEIPHFIQNDLKNQAFRPKENLSPVILMSHLQPASPIFRHAIRLTVAVLTGLIVSYTFDSDKVKWIILTILVILRPNFGLTKNRAINRIEGTCLGILFSYLLILIQLPPLFLSILSIVSLLIGFSYIQRNYRVASTYITISVILYYVIIDQKLQSVIENRAIFSFIGAIISMISIYTIFPAWENYTIKNTIKNILEASLKYHQAIMQLYHTPTTLHAYKLARKEVFLKNSQLISAFQRMQADPKNKQDNMHNVYAIVLLLQELLSCLAALSTFTQSRGGEQPSVVLFKIMQNIDNSLASIYNFLDHNSPISLQKSQVELFEINQLKKQLLKNIKHNGSDTASLGLNYKELNQMSAILLQINQIIEAISLQIKCIATV